MAPLADISDLETWLAASFTEAEAERAALLLTSVSSLVRSHCGRTWEDTDPPPEVAAVVLNVAARVWRNPQAATSWSKTTGPFGESMTFPNPGAVGLYLGPDDKAALPARTPSAGAVGGLRTVATTRADPYPSTTYVPTPDGQPFPWYGEDVT